MFGQNSFTQQNLKTNCRIWKKMYETTRIFHKLIKGTHDWKMKGNLGMRVKRKILLDHLTECLAL